MARFTVIHCQGISPISSEFVVRMDAGDVRVGDRFWCNGAFRPAKFRIQSIVEKEDHTILKCAGPVAFDDEFVRMNVELIPPYVPPPNLVKPLHLPIATAQEEAWLKRDDDWHNRAPLQQGILICLVRGASGSDEAKTFESVAATLGVSVLDVKEALQGLSDFCVSSTKRLYLR